MFFRFPDWKYFRYDIEERWKRLTAKPLALREWINDNPRIMIGITAVCMVVFLGILMGQLMPPKAPKIQKNKRGWFYDLNTGELFTAKSDLVPPLEAPSGPLPNGRPAGVKAYVFSYADEPNESDYFIGFLEIPDPQAQEDTPDSAMSATPGARQWGKGKLIRRVEDKQWVRGDSGQGRAILREVYLPNEKGLQPYYCPSKKEHSKFE
jgi:hypothetical protein